MAKQPITMEPVELTPEQQVRLATALAKFDAKHAALKAGMSLAQVQSQEWLVDVDAIKAQLI